ncbi:DUF3857 domain-containing protein [Cecembia sp.]|uniref:DUF3857 domain-containing protein n=1 Tax=Cecembia sp. TaxID=1898110 RepID=UPI0025BE5A07|nr:DUF3857 domain-containing protein [Cecembia sp.]
MCRSLIFTIFLIGLVNLHIEAQELIYGRYTTKEIEFEAVDFEPEADAVVLGEISTNKIVIPELESNVLRRIKILKPSGIQHGTVTIPFYSGSNSYVRMTKVKAQVTNIVDGTPKTLTLKEGDFFTVDLGNGWKEIRFTLPDVQVGSIIDYQYSKIDKRLTILEGWVFQNQIPTLVSIYSIDIPSELNYRVLSQGEQTLKHKFDWKKDGTYKWILKDLRSFKEEPYMSSPSDYYEKIEFQLAGYGFRGSNSVFADWPELAKHIVNIESFRSYIKPNKTYTQKLQELNVVGDNQLQMAKAIYDYMLENYEFDGYVGILPTDHIKQLLETKKNSRPELNLLLLAYLNQHGIEADPVLISSKGNGRSNIIDSPFADQFNQLILTVMADGKSYFVDVTNKEVPFGYLPVDFHVEKGFLIKDKESRLIPIQVNHRSGIQQSVNFKLEGGNDWVSDATIRFLDYDGIRMDRLKEKNGEEYFQKETMGFNMDQTQGFSFSSRNDPRKVVDMKWQKTFSTNGEELLFIEPFLYSRFSENPFQADSRTFPIDFYHGFLDNFNTSIDIPDGYELDDFPEDVSVALTNGTFSFNYKVTAMENTVKINSTIDLKQHVLPAILYQDLKYFMEIVTSKLKEPVVLRKTTLP